MTSELIVAALGVATLSGLVGYLWGARRGALARTRLDQALRTKEEALRRSKLELSGVLKAEKAAHLQSQTLAPATERSERLEDRLEEIERRDADRMQTLLAQLQQLRGSIEGGSQAALAAEVRDVVGPLADRARLQTALTDLPDTFLHRGHLSRLLVAVAERAALSAVILSDEAGLPLAEASSDASETLAAAASLLLTLSDRLSRSGQPGAVGAVVQDSEGRLVLHRIFQAGDERYVLTGVAKGRSLFPDSLDPVLPQIRQLLVQRGAVFEAVA